MEILTIQGSYIDLTTAELQRIAPDSVIPAQSTGRKAVMRIEREMPDGSVLNMSGTKPAFAAP